MDEFENQHPIISPEQLDWETYRQQGLATSILELPPLAEGHVRGVHITFPNNVDSILSTGLDYSRQGMLMSTANVWSDPEQIEYTTEDSRWPKGTVDIVFDLTYAESKQFNRLGPDNPGVVSRAHIVGVVDPYKEDTEFTQEAH